MPKKRTPEEQREYMRQYRAKKAGKTQVTAQTKRQVELEAEIDRLTEEVRQLKRQLAEKAQVRFDSVVPDMLNAVAGPQTATPRGVVFHPKRSSPDRLSKSYFARKRKA